ncbi:hypothetical protein [Algoriphagus sp. Y33]|uniref:hypothetical protein n=1 Tax=Algoriphagus sp. Y33 TaxID=2772483 RepID=UPI00177FE80A|nr:hypothetical protein [Algoriphagus sp. Y33]
MKSDRDILIDGYFEKTLTALQQTEFDRLMLEDSSFAEEVTFHRKLKAAIRMEERENLKARFDTIDATPSPSYRWWYAAAAVLALMAMGWWISSQIPQQPKDLYYAYFEPYPNTVEPLVRSDAGQKGLSVQAFHLYEEGEYAKAGAAFGRLYQESNKEQDLFYQAISLMAAGKTTEALPLLERQEWTASYFEASQWYLALAYLKEEQLSQAKTHLKKVRDAKGFLSSQATKLLKELD